MPIGHIKTIKTAKKEKRKDKVEYKTNFTVEKHFSNINRIMNAVKAVCHLHPRTF